MNKTTMADTGTSIGKGNPNMPNWKPTTLLLNASKIRGCIKNIGKVLLLIAQINLLSHVGFLLGQFEGNLLRSKKAAAEVKITGIDRY